MTQTDVYTVPPQSPLRMWSVAQMAVNHGWSVTVSKHRLNGEAGWQMRAVRRVQTERMEDGAVLRSTGIATLLARWRLKGQSVDYCAWRLDGGSWHEVGINDITHVIREDGYWSEVPA